MVACTLDLRFMYVLAGWEGSASDSRIIKHVLTEEWELHIPQGKRQYVFHNYHLYLLIFVKM